MLKKLRRIFVSWSGFAAGVSIIVFSVVTYLGEGVGFAANGTCSPYLGCVNGFFGFDAIEHFLFGVAFVCIVVWISDTFPKYSILGENKWRNLLILVALVALAGTLWEVIECTQDAIQLQVLHDPILNYRLHINYLVQPSNFDTMGDESFNIAGGILAAITWIATSFRVRKQTMKAIAVTAIFTHPTKGFMLYVRDEGPGGGVVIKYPNTPSFFGGTLEPEDGGNVMTCLVREMDEELELVLDPAACHEIFVYDHDNGTDHVFHCPIRGDEGLHLHEGREVMWVSDLDGLKKLELAWNQHLIFPHLEHLVM